MKSYLGLNNIVADFLSHIFASMFPLHFGEVEDNINISAKKEKEAAVAKFYLQKSLAFFYDEEETINSVTEKLMGGMPEVFRVINTDIRAAYEGDPAAQSEDEVILSYPAFKAISTYRIAHQLYLLKVPVIPRMMTEQSHSNTGIDIHPGATIGEYFFIDHGTGVVIGETTTIGERVRIYQHVTLGAKSFEVGEDGTLVKGIKRHPDIGNHVVIYAGATILGGNTHIGDGAVIGGNTWITHSVPAGETVTIKVYGSKSSSEK